MSLRRWACLIGILTALGFLKVSQQTTMWLRAYALGERVRGVHELENETQWLKAHVTALRSPAQLVKAMGDQGFTLVAWSELSPSSAVTQLAQASEDTTP